MRIFSLGDSAITVEFGKDISPDLNARSIALANSLSTSPFPGFYEAVPAYASVTVYFDPYTVRLRFPDASAFETVSEFINGTATDRSADTQPRIVEIPMIVSHEASPDLSDVAEFASVSTDEVIDIFLSHTYRVYMLGFLPGFAYMGEVDERIAMPRKTSPRKSVAKGSIGIAGKQTGIYPLASPGGWQLIGRTETAMFNAAADEPCLLRPGDEVRFTI